MIVTVLVLSMLLVLLVGGVYTLTCSSTNSVKEIYYYLFLYVHMYRWTYIVAVMSAISVSYQQLPDMSGNVSYS